jgi:SAM-dependent methyltransferase
MAHSFDRDYWQQHWEQTGDPRGLSGTGGEANPHLVREITGLRTGSALDAGCGSGAEARWLARQGWRVTGADISAVALAQAQAAESAAATVPASVAAVAWVEADLTSWQPEHPYDLVVTSYAHPAMGQLAFYDRIADWVVPGGTLLIVGHLHRPGQPDHHARNSATHVDPHAAHHPGEEPPVEATVALADITARFDPRLWQIVTAEEHTRPRPGGSGAPLHDVILRATRRLPSREL